MYEIFYAEPASIQLLELDKNSKKKIVKAIELFKEYGIEAKNSKKLQNQIWEIKADNVRAYFQYYENMIVIIGFITLKKTQKAPVRFIEQAEKNIQTVIEELKNYTETETR